MAPFVLQLTETGPNKSHSYVRVHTDRRHRVCPPGSVMLLTLRLSLSNDEYRTRSDAKTKVNSSSHRGSHLTSKFTNSSYYMYLLASVDERLQLLLYPLPAVCFVHEKLKTKYAYLVTVIGSRPTKIRIFR